MKHLVKKFVNASKVGNDVIEVFNNAPIDEKVFNEISNNNLEGYYALALTDKKYIMQTFKYLKDGNLFIIPEPDPIIIYFDTAVHFHKSILKRKTELFSKLTNLDEKFTAINGDFYWYFSTVCSHVIFLFLSIEAFLNKSIPNGFEYRKPIQDKKVEIYDKFQIQRSIDFLEKIKIVIPQALGRNFVTEYSHKYDLLKKLKEFRDEIVHTKSFEGKTTPNFYEDLFVIS